MNRRLSPQALAVLSALAEPPLRERHGYDLGRQVGLKAGSLYPILIRLADRGLVAASWEVDSPPGRPRRHLYRILGAGVDLLLETTTERRSTASATLPTSGSFA